MINFQKFQKQENPAVKQIYFAVAPATTAYTIFFEYLFTLYKQYLCMFFNAEHSRKHLKFKPNILMMDCFKTLNYKTPKWQFCNYNTFIANIWASKVSNLIGMLTSLTIKLPLFYCTQSERLRQPNFPQRWCPLLYTILLAYWR